jgi:hypothetical protein
MQIIPAYLAGIVFFLSTFNFSAGITVGEPLELKNVFTHQWWKFTGMFQLFFHNTNFLPEFYFFCTSFPQAPKTPPLL